MVPDSAKAIDVTFADGSTSSVKVRDNVFAFAVGRAASPPTVYSWHSQRTKIEVPVRVSELVRQAQCE
jgi:hypothetical protein